MAATMSEQDESRRDLTTVEAGRILGVSKEMVRRMIREGKLEASGSEPAGRAACTFPELKTTKWGTRRAPWAMSSGPIPG
jgi:hypothetical protein